MTITLPPVLTLISELIASPSVSCVNPDLDMSNQLIINKLANWCQDLGFDTEILPIANNPGKFNLLARLGSGEGGLVLAGHTDTVPYDAALWQTDPFQLTEVDGCLYGLGTADMKAFFALALTATQAFKAKTLRQPLMILATADEESGMSGAQALLQAGYPQARWALIGEPTGLRPVRMHKGILMEAIGLRGRSGHSSNPRLGNNALEGMFYVIKELLNWRTELQQHYQQPAFNVPEPTLNLGHIQGGDNPNRICGACELHFDLRPLPGMDIQQLRTEMRQRVQAVLAERQLEIDFWSLFEGIPPFETPQQTEIIRVTEQLTQTSAQAVAYATEAPYLQALGMETVILGPGDIEQAHQPNEFIRLDRLQPMTDILTQMIQHFCF